MGNTLPPEVTIRDGVPDDAPVIAQLVVALTAEICERSGSPPLNVDLRETTDTCRRLVSEGRYLTLLVFAANQPIGVATLCEGFALYAGGAIATVEEFYVEPGWRSRRVGKGLMERIRPLGRERGWRAIELCTPPLPAFDRTVDFYERCDFAISGGRKMRTWLKR